jgi:hypothetical protein
MEGTARKFAVWRRAVLFVAAVPCVFAALFALIAVLAMEKEQREQLSVFGMFLLYVQAFALYALPAAALLGALTYERLSVSARWVLLGGLVSLAVPLVVVFAPTEWLLDLKEDPRAPVAEVARARFDAGIGIGMKFSLLLVPVLTALVLAMTCACARMKQFLPESLVPGWGLVTGTPVFVLLALVTFVLLYHMLGNPLLLFALFLWIGAPLLYLTQFNLFTRPVTAPADQAALARTSIIVFAVMALGVLLLVIYLFTAKALGATILGFDERTSAIRPWNLELHRQWLEYVGRALFLWVFFSDLVLRAALSVWREERAFAGTPGAAGFDRTMSGLDSALLPRGSTPTA